MAAKNQTIQSEPNSSTNSKWKERTPTFIAITTLVLAVCATLSSFKAGGYSTKMVLAQSQASDQWAYYQAKSIKETAYQTQRDAMELAKQSNPASVEAYQAKIAAYDQEVAVIKMKKMKLWQTPRN